MNRIKSYIMLLCLMLSIGTAIHAQSRGTRFEPKKAATAELFFDSNVSVTASIEPQEVVVPIALASEVDITAFQADLYLPQQFILAGIDTGAIVTDTHEFTTSEKDGYTRIMCSSSNNSPFTSNYGIVARLRVIVPAYALGEFEMRLRNISLADTATPANRYDTYDQGGIIRANENPLWEPFCQVRDTLRVWMERVEEMAPGFAEEDSTWWAESGINSVIPQSPTAVLDSMIQVVEYKTTNVIATYDLLQDYNARLEMLLEMSKDLMNRTYQVYEDPKYEAFKDRLELCLMLNDECRAMLNEHYIYKDNGYFKETEPTASDELQKKYEQLDDIRYRLEDANQLLFEVLNQGNNIQFADENVKAICVSHWDEDRDGELSYEEAAAVTSLGGAFQGANNITSFNELQYFTGLTAIGWGSFNGCTGLTSITIPNSVTAIGEQAFYGCSGLTNVTIPNSVTEIGGWAFGSCSGLTSITIPNSVTVIGGAAFYGCSGLTSVTIPNSVTAIGASAFNGCSGLTNVIIPNSVTEIGENAFGYCTSLTNVTIPNSVTAISNEVFSNCSSLTNVTIPNSVTAIGAAAFQYCSNLTSVIIPDSVTEIGDYAFCYCHSLKDVYVYWKKPLTVPSNTFYSVPVESATLHVPTGTKALYKAAEVWKDFYKIDDGTQDYGGDPIEFADANVRKVCIDNWDFNGDGEFTTGEAEHVYDLGDAFIGNTNIKSFLELKYFTGLEKITNENFMGCTNLKVMACEKQNLEIEDQVMTHPNAMLYIYGGVNSNFGGNTIWHGEAKEIVLTDGEELDIPVEFYAEQISYTRNFEKKTYPGVCAGWETIVLPFDVYSITHETKGQLAPIHSGLAGKSFWLGTLQDRGGFMNDVRIRANVPYLISMPNSDSYADQYNLNGKVTFSSENVMVRRTNEVESIWGSTYALVPTYDFIDAPDIYTINDDSYMNYYPGGVFTKGLRSARPFEAFVVVEHGNAKGYIDLFGDDPSGIADIMPAINESHEVYDLNGRKVATDGKALSRMPHGVYIIDGKKIVK